MVSDGEVNVANKNPYLELWHMSQKRLEVLARKTMLPEVTCMHLETCLSCFASKQHRVACQHILPIFGN